MLRFPKLTQHAELFLVGLGDLLVLGRVDVFFLAAEGGGFLDPLDGREVLAEFGHAGRSEALRGRGEHFEAQTEVAADDFDHVAGAEFARGFHAGGTSGECRFRFLEQEITEETEWSTLFTL